MYKFLLSNGNHSKKLMYKPSRNSSRLPSNNPPQSQPPSRPRGKHRCGGQPLDLETPLQTPPRWQTAPAPQRSGSAPLGIQQAG